MSNQNFFIIDIINLSSTDCVRFFPIETQRIDTETNAKN
jgi:hypothetical protein